MKQYLDMLSYVLENGDQHNDRTGVGTISTFGYQNRYDLRDGFPLLTTKKMFTKGIIVELMWFLRGITNNKWLNDRGVHIWDEWATKEQCAKFGREEGDLGKIYSEVWNNFGGDYQKFNGINQISQLINDINNNPFSRRLIVSGWDPRVATKVSLPPCHTLWQCKVIEKEGIKYLDLHLYQRSQDAFLGGPFNIASYALLNHLIAHVCGLKSRNLIISVGDLHIYNNHIDQVSLQLSRKPLQLPTITINDRLKGGGYDALVNFELEDIIINNYKCHPAIKAPVAV